MALPSSPALNSSVRWSFDPENLVLTNGLVLPTPEQVKEATHVIQCFPLARLARNVVKIGTFAIKYGNQVTLLEAQNVEFLRGSCDIPLPKIHAAYTYVDGLTYIIMDFIDGQSLVDIERQLSPAELSFIAQKLKLYTSRIRNLPSPGSTGTIDGKCVADYLFHPTRLPELHPAASFPSEEAMVEAIDKITTTILG